MNHAAPSCPHILIVDDQPDDQRSLVELFRQAGLRISIAFDGVQAYRRALAGNPDVILMDVHMPTLDGFGACRLIKSDPAISSIPILFLTAAGGLADRLYGLRNGGADYIVKPCAPEEILARVELHLGSNGPRATRGTDMFAAGLSPASILVRAAQQYLSAHLAAPPSLAEIAREIGTHEKRLSRAFRQHAGMTVFEFIRQERLRVARRLLSQTSLSVTAIAEEVGFTSAANFATAFRQHTGMTPTAFRAAMHAGIAPPSAARTPGARGNVATDPDPLPAMGARGMVGFAG